MEVDILLPAPQTDMGLWPALACDQFTSQPEYWQKAEALTQNAPSTLHITLPEAYLESPDVENQLNTRITQALEQDIQKMELQLEPEGLGKLVIQMEKSPEGALHVVLQASNETALQMLKDHSGSLGLMLQNSQAAPVRLEVQRQDNPEQNPWNQQEQNQNQNHSQQQQQQRRQENRQSEDFLQKLRLGLMPA